MQRRIQRYGWDKAADAYEAGWKESLADAHAEVLRQANAQPGEHVLDLACGTGLVSFPLAMAVGPSGRILATDISEKMIFEIRQIAKSRGVEHFSTARADAENIEMLPDCSVDLVTCALGLMYVADPSKAIAETLRVLKPGGRAVLAVWGERAKCGWAEIFPIVDERVKSTVCPFFFRLGTGSSLATAMSTKGFVDVETTRLLSELPYSDDQAAIEAAFAGGPVALAYHRFDAATREAAHREYLASIAQFRTPNGYHIPGEFVVCRGVKSA
ncbi:MAG: methyltransferase domain-containing protein [Pseudomonadota bacterium]